MHSLAYTDGEIFTLNLRGLFSDLSLIQEKQQQQKKNITEVGGCFHVLLVQQSRMREIPMYSQNHSCIS